MGEQTIRTRTMQRAAEIVGGPEQLAQRLQAPSVEVQRWMRGDHQPPQAYFLRAVDIVQQTDANVTQATPQKK